eukprot:CAMPEP_0172541244 /NCGR_PEP_ID=MMETSP1067-20121228/12085_1 /TAXON_ID=265564 ORGANISM="Thalassiosira punctigera, Strain Tpunct2005C2" /NCGR_SAMPLE_ID=MMETSP1067 /ASSEMBLY_ACC=CAM_ASM_000444 /LENGTH=322 /DNA_ID=CAMNT_0013327245 /DNA_START=158 /DNA_END=1126 /DNA_ORIENTATION=+
MTTVFLRVLSAAAISLQWHAKPTAAFQFQTTAQVPKARPRIGARRPRDGRSSVVLGANDGSGDVGGAASAAEAQRLLAKARAIRESLPDASAESGESERSASKSDPSSKSKGKIPSKFSLPSEEGKDCYRLYLDIGRERGTWMDPRWGSSGRRIECTLDVAFASPSAAGEDGMTTPAAEDIAEGLLKTVTSKSSSLSPVYNLQSAPYARLRGGFDRMAIHDGGYCVESSAGASSSTLRFCLSVNGATDGDVTMPEGKLYFALPYFGLRTDDGGGAKMALSNREGTVTVKQMGWHTGWYREESRILGVFRAAPLERARERDRF